MGFLEDKLYWTTTRLDGSPRSLIAMILDPVGACIQPSDLHPFDWVVQEVQQDQQADENATAETVKDATESEQEDKASKVESTPPVSPLPPAPVAAEEKV